MSGSTVITIGAFDGVHLGHASLIGAARSAGGTVTTLAFDPHPAHVIRPGTGPVLLSSFEQRREWLTKAGADEVVALEPTPELLNRSPKSFLDWLVGQYNPDVIVEGTDFHFGHDRAGSVETLRQHERSLGYRTLVVADVEATLTDGTEVRVSSSLIRRLVGWGRVRDAARLLGRPYELRGEVVRGDGRGGPLLGVATANLDHGTVVLPADGIYVATATGPAGRTWPAAVSIGTKPTFGENPRVCEAHLIDYDGATDEYGWAMRIEFHDWIRDQVAFDGAEALIEQIHRDIDRVRQAIADRHRREPVLNR
jgi:riboflavin kinase/FMN adenylyltransferase